IELARAGGVVIDSWVLPWLYRGGFNIWLKAGAEFRAGGMLCQNCLEELIRAKVAKEWEETSSISPATTT
ncbi:MAG: hypothetical protein DRN65_01070, partial [Thaumarchaeota archaeon]